MKQKVKPSNNSNKLPPELSLVRKILDTLLDFADDIITDDPRFNVMGYKGNMYRDLFGEPDNRSFKESLAYLKKREEIKVVKKNDKIFMKLTKKGKLRALLLRLCRDFKKQPKWDGKWRLIMWDIPEKYSHERDNIRNLVKGLGFYQLQKSAFITPYILPQSAVAYLRESKLVRFVRFLRVERFENDRWLKRHFGLK